MLQYTDVVALLEAKLSPPLPYFDPGPGSDQVVIDQNPDEMCIISLTGGPGLDSEQVFDRAGLQIRTVGPQADYEGAETLAFNIDKALVSIDTSQAINGKHTLSIMRAGSGPSLLLIDDGGRYHFTCNYIWEVVY